MNKCSAKDAAFREKTLKLKRQIKEREQEINERDCKIAEMKYQLSEVELKCEQLQDWVDRLLEYANLSEEEMKKMIACAESSQMAIKILDVMGKFL